MIENNIDISIITLIKNNNSNFVKTLQSIFDQKFSYLIEWIIIDGSNELNAKYLNSLIEINLKKNNIKNINLRYLNSKNKRIFGIYQCMNYGKSISNGKYIIFLNGGDSFFNSQSLEELYKRIKDVKDDYSLIFGNAQIIAPYNIKWYFPGKKVKNIKRWLKYFEPNHQSMLVSRKLADKYDFSYKYNLISDGYWKRELINKADKVIFINKSICKFRLDGISSTKPSKSLIKKIIANKNISFLRKIIFYIKYILPKNLFYPYYILQKYKALFFEILF